MILGEETKELIKETEQPSLEDNIMALFKIMQDKGSEISPDALVYTAGIIWRAHDPLWSEMQIKYIIPVEDIKKEKVFTKSYNNSKYTGDFFLNHNSKNNPDDTFTPAECYSIAEFAGMKILRSAMAYVLGYMANNTIQIMDMVSDYYKQEKINISNKDYENFKNYLFSEINDHMKQILWEHGLNLEFIEKALIKPKPDSN